MTDKVDLMKTLQQVFVEVFDDVPPLTDHLKADEVDGWDSLMHIQLMLAIEKRFGIKFAVSEVNGLKNVGELVTLIQKKIND